MVMRPLLAAVLLSPAAVQGTCFPGFSTECCAGIRDAESNPAMQKAMWGLEEVSGEAEAAAFAKCKATLSPCVAILPNHTQVSASCCAADALAGWQTPGPAAAVLALLAAANSTSHHGRQWWVTINQTLSHTSGIVQQVISHQYPSWYPSSCDNATALAAYQVMMCSGAGSVIECEATMQADDS